MQIGGVIHFSDNRYGGHEFFSAIRNRKSADLIPDADIFFIIAVNSFMVQYRKQCVFGKGGYAIFLTLMGGSCNFII